MRLRYVKHGLLIPANWRGSGPGVRAYAGCSAHPGSRSSAPCRTLRPPAETRRQIVLLCEIIENKSLLLKKNILNAILL